MKTFSASFGRIDILLVRAFLKVTFSSRFIGRNTSLLVAVFLFSFSSAFADSAKLDFNGHSYQRFDTGMSWTSAKDFCETKGAHLATVTSQAEHDFIASNFAPRDLWLGASDAVSEGNWAWVTGEPWAFTNWYPGEPNNFGGVENYLVTDTSVLKKWNDVPNAGDNFVPLCEWDSYGASQSAGDQFSPSSNPNGTWSYGYKLTSSSPFQVFDTGSATARGIAGMYGWNASTLASEPHIYFNSTASTIGFANTVNVPARSIQMHPGPNGVFAVLRWTAPTSGIYTIEGAFRGNDSNGGARIASIQKNGVEVFSGSALASGQLLPFNTANTLSVGDTLDFMVDPNGPHQNDSTGLTLTIANVNALPLTQGLVGHYSLDGNTNDTGTNGFNAALHGNVVLASGKTWASFNPDLCCSGYVDADAALNRNTSFSLGLWVRPRAVDNGGVSAIMFEREGGDVCGVNSAGNYGLTIYTGSFAFETATLNASSVCSQVRMFVPNPVLLNTWTHLTAVYESGTGEMRLYVGGALAGTTQVNQTLRTQPGARLFLGRNPGAAQPFLGDMSDVRIYDRVLANSEISALANALPAANGRCGIAAGVATATQPTTNLCASGTTTGAVSNPPNWTWTCLGSNTGTDASCTAPIAATPAVVLSLPRIPTSVETVAHGDGHLGERMDSTPRMQDTLRISCPTGSCTWSALVTPVPVTWLKINSLSSGTATSLSPSDISFSVDPFEETLNERVAYIQVTDGTGTAKSWKITQKPLTDCDADGVADEWEQRGYPRISGRSQLLGSYRDNAGLCETGDRLSPGRKDMCDKVSAPYGKIVSTSICEDPSIAGVAAKKAARDLWLWIDEMEGLTASQQMSQSVPRVVSSGFRDQGVTLRWVSSKDFTYRVPNQVLRVLCPTNATDFSAIKLANLVSNNNELWRNKVYHHAIWGKQYSINTDCGSNTGTSSGIALSVTHSYNLFIVAAGVFNTSLTSQAGTLMHELGHELGLNHGGPFFRTSTEARAGAKWPASDDPLYDHKKNYKPNHISVMNYRYQLGGLIATSGSHEFNFQTYGYAPVNEANLTSYWANPLVRFDGTRENLYGLTTRCNNDLFSDYYFLTEPGQQAACANGTTPSKANLDGESLPISYNTHVVKSEWDHIFFNILPGSIDANLGVSRATAQNGLDLSGPNQFIEEAPANSLATPSSYSLQIGLRGGNKRRISALPGTNGSYPLDVQNAGFKRVSVSTTATTGCSFITVDTFAPFDISPSQYVAVPLVWHVDNMAPLGATCELTVKVLALQNPATYDEKSIEVEIVNDPVQATPPIAPPVEARTVNDFSLLPAVGAQPDTYVESNYFVLSGFDVSLPIQVRGGEMSINGAEWTHYASTVNDGDTVRLRVVSSPWGGETRAAEVAVGGLTRSFDVTTILTCSLDVDGDSNVLASKDGVVLNRYLLGFRGDALVAGLSLSGSHSTAQAISDFIGSGVQYDVFGRDTASPSATVDGLVLTRLMLGIPDSALLSGVTIPSSASFKSAVAVRNFVNMKCGTNLGSP